MKRIGQGLYFCIFSMPLDFSLSGVICTDGTSLKNGVPPDPEEKKRKRGATLPTCILGRLILRELHCSSLIPF